GAPPGGRLVAGLVEFVFVEGGGAGPVVPGGAVPGLAGGGFLLRGALRRVFVPPGLRQAGHVVRPPGGGGRAVASAQPRGGRRRGGGAGGAAGGRAVPWPIAIRDRSRHMGPFAAARGGLMPAGWTASSARAVRVVMAGRVPCAISQTVIGPTPAAFPTAWKVAAWSSRWTWSRTGAGSAHGCPAPPDTGRARSRWSAC